MTQLSRRTFQQLSLQGFLTFSLLETLHQHEAFASDVKPTVDKWVTELNQMSSDIKGQKLSQADWQKKVEELFSQVNLPDLLKFIDFERLTKSVKWTDNGARSLRFGFPEVEGLPKKYVFGKQIFALKKDRSVVPHGHNNMATAFLVLQGDFHGRHYDRVEDEKTHLVIKPTIDQKFTAGGHSTVTDQKDNIHWFRAESETGFIFNIHVMDVQPESKLRTGRVYLDPNGEKLSGGLIRAKRIGHQEAHQLYG